MHSLLVVVCLFLLSSLAFSFVSTENNNQRVLFSNALDGINLLTVSNTRFMDNANIKLLVDIHVHENVILHDFHLAQLNAIVHGSGINLSSSLNVVSGTNNRVFRTRLSLNRIQEIRQSVRSSEETNYKHYIHKIERVSNEKRLLFPQFSLDSLRFSKVRIVMSDDYEEQQLGLFLSKINTKFNNEFATQLIDDSSFKRSNVDEILRTKSIIIEEKGRMFSISLSSVDSDFWNTKNGAKRSSLLSHMSDFLMTNILENEHVDYIEREYSQSLLSFGTNEVVQNNRKVNVSRFAWDNGVTGKGEIVQVIDSGIDFSHCYFSSPNEDYLSLNTNNRKLVLYEKGKPTGDRYDGNGHGTHCSGIIAGNPSSSSSIDQDVGIAKDAKIYMIDSAISILFNVENMTTYLTSAFLSGSRISSNSWGSANGLDCLFDCDCYESKSNYTKPVSDEFCLKQYGLRCCQLGNTYETLSAQIDEFTNKNDEMLVVFAAGNSGYYGMEKSVISPSTSKNCISVGASYGTTEEYSRYNPSINGTLYNHENLGYFSGRGPTFDNRFKPDIVAPGVAIWSARSFIPFCDSSGLMQRTGTSMACPAVSGVSALVREYFLQNNKQRLINLDLINKEPAQTLSGMLVKAFVIHSGEKMMGNVKLDGPLTNGNDNHYYNLAKENLPNRFTGFGRVNIANTMKFSDKDQNPDLFTVNRQKIHPSSNITISMIRMINSSSSSLSDPLLKVTLTWFDLKGTPVNPSTRTNKQLINNLDLSISIKEQDRETNQILSTTQCFGNQPCTLGQIQDSSLIDDRNNVESVTILPSSSSNTKINSSSLTITITISASEKNVGAQNFALLISGFNLKVSSVKVPPDPVLSRGSSSHHYSITFIVMMTIVVVLLLW